MRASKPPNVLLTRIENRSGGGVPDVHGIVDGLPFWLELKVKSSARVNVRPHQIAWHTSFFAKRGLSFFLVSTQTRGSSALIRGNYATQLAQNPLSEVQGPRFGDFGSMWEGISVAVWSHYRDLVAD